MRGVGSDPTEHPLQRRQLTFKPLHAGRQLAVRRRRLYPRMLGESDADLVAVPPDDVRAQRLLFLRNVELESRPAR